jgi:hypothetical protein
MTTTPDNAADGQTRKVPAVACTDLLAPVTEDKTPTLEVAIRNAVGWIRTLSPLYPKMSDWLLDMAEDPKWRRHLATTEGERQPQMTTDSQQQNEQIKDQRSGCSLHRLVSVHGGWASPVSFGGGLCVSKGIPAEAIASTNNSLCNLSSRSRSGVSSDSTDCPLLTDSCFAISISSDAQCARTPQRYHNTRSAVWVGFFHIKSTPHRAVA